MGGPSIHDRFKDDRDSKVSAHEFFSALGHSAQASGMGRRVYAQADKGSASASAGYKEQGTPFVGQVGERRTYEPKPAPPNVPSISNANDVLNALGPNQQFDPHYAAAVLDAFVRGQLEMGSREADVTSELNDIEASLQQYAQAGVFNYIRQTYRLEAPPAYHGQPPSYQ